MKGKDRLMSRLFVLAGVVLLAAACGPTYDIPAQEIEFQLSASPAPGEVTVTLTTNVPEGSRIHVALLRPYRHQGDDEARMGTAASTVLTVTEGKGGPITLMVDDQRWYDEVVARVRAGEAPPLVGVESRIKVLALFTPRLQQEAEIYRQLGDDFRQLRGAPQLAAGAGEDVDFYYLEADALVNQGFPFERRVEPEE